jgi:hypothetical protein
MKSIYLGVLFVFFSFVMTEAQNNLIPNPSFEFGRSGNHPHCVYPSATGDWPNYIEENISEWTTATCKKAPTNCRYKYSRPDWMDSNCNDRVFGLSYYNHRFIYFQKDGGNGKQDAIRTQLISTLDHSKNYGLKLMCTAVPKKGSSNPIPETAYTRVFLTKFANNWSANWGNVKISFYLTVPTYNIAPYGWHEIGTIINGNYFQNWLGNVFPVLNNFVIDCEEGYFYVDNVELKEMCGSPLLVQNHNFNPFQNEYPYRSSDVIKAGTNVGANNGTGKVIVKSSATINFEANNRIELLDGFEAEDFSNFVAEIKPCDQNGLHAPAIFNKIDENTYSLNYDGNYFEIYNDATDTIYCNDSIAIYGLDGDTISYAEYNWDFGDGRTYNGAVANIKYSNEGSYLVKLFLTDSLGTIDTLSKNYVVVCDSSNNRSMGIHYTEQSRNKSGIEVLPNPNNGSFTLTYLNQDEKSALKEIKVYDILGQTVWRTSTTTSSTYNIDISQASPGIYYVKALSNNGEVMVKKVVKE